MTRVGGGVRRVDDEVKWYLISFPAHLPEEEKDEEEDEEEEEKKKEEEENENENKEN